MKLTNLEATLAMFVVLLPNSLSVAGAENSQTVSNLWAHSNLVAWCVVPFDAKSRGPEERAQMLASLGFKNFAYDWRDKDVPTFDAEIDALAKHEINLLAWWFPFDADDPAAKSTLETFRRHRVHPQLWVPQSSRDNPQTPEEWAKWMPDGLVIPRGSEDYEKLSQADKAEIQKAYSRFTEASLKGTAGEQAQRVQREAERIKAIVALAAPYGVEVELYNHNEWYGMEENQLAIIERLKTMGVTNVGMVYNFSHGRDEFHDDTVDFPAVWKRIKPYVVNVNITGTHMDGELIYPSQGDRELEMMRTIQESGWRGTVGLIAEKGGDAEVTLKNYLVGLDWLAAELKQSGSGGPRPFPVVQSGVARSR